MIYTFSITSKGQVTIPKAFRDRLGLDKTGKASMRMNDRGEVILTAPKDLKAVRSMLAQPSHREPLSDKEQIIAEHLIRKYDVH